MAFSSKMETHEMRTYRHIETLNSVTNMLKINLIETI